MKQLRALQNTPHCMGTKSYARLSYEEVVKDVTPPTRAKSYITTHVRKYESYPNDIANERCEMMVANANRPFRIVKRDKVLSCAIERVLEGEWARHKAQMDEVLERALEGERAHKAQMDEVLAAQSEIMSCFSQIELMWRQSEFLAVVSNNNAVPNKNFHTSYECDIFC
ncbi:uncharacterized protein LOC133876972 [Alnus glutinosa]|uniref:uncharacterized protein LOC133876972 n=1 Tax=Alnus glutinosa TaxID=3517 RepID=UPI002D771B41|nr:uncharacterized protein LOC133876972 [Alnus glutinosa]